MLFAKKKIVPRKNSGTCFGKISCKNMKLWSVNMLVVGSALSCRLQ